MRCTPSTCRLETVPQTSRFEDLREVTSVSQTHCCPIFPELRPILDEAFEIFGEKSEYVVAVPQYQSGCHQRRVQTLRLRT